MIHVRAISVVFWVVSAGAASAPLSGNSTADTMHALIRAAEIVEYFEVEDGVVVAACVHERLGSRWPARPLSSLEPDEIAPIQAAVESCAAERRASLGTINDHLRGNLTTIGQQANAQAMSRLLTLIIAANCTIERTPSEAKTCLEKLAGTPLNEAQTQALYAALHPSVRRPRLKPLPESTQSPAQSVRP